MYGGLQRLILPDGTSLPLIYRWALTTLLIRKPTLAELATITPIDITSPVPWDPHQPYSLDAAPQQRVDPVNLAAPPDQVLALPARGVSPCPTL